MTEPLVSLKVDIADRVAEVTLLGPGKGNAMGPDFWRELPRVFGELARVAFHDDSSRFHHVRAIRMMQRGVGVLFDEQNRRAFGADVVDRFENRVHDDRR